MASNSQRDKSVIVDDKIILNVGGIKYETCKSTFTAYPETMLGTMFHERNKFMLHPISGNEHFIDRDGLLFQYVMKFYRTGKVPRLDEIITPVPISQEELDEELDFFMIPRNKPVRVKPAKRVHVRDSIISSQLAAFINALRQIISILFLQFKEEFLINRHFPIGIQLTFYERKKVRIFIIAPPSGLKSRIEKIIQPFEGIGFCLLEGFAEDVERYFEDSITGIEWDCIERRKYLEHGGMVKLFDLRITLDDKCDKTDLIKSCCLKRGIGENG
ncbi:4325_t:CDS:2 [Paraglomus occultum]|uniref:4325_t:CDS:1 n=1 Tax=Paraglomus occultum TaxID=144539 RepID=A0A9N9A7U8_9GLOM|nr:4325_t:CDS:2 [Paraglomus occultum]